MIGVAVLLLLFVILLAQYARLYRDARKDTDR